MHVRHALRDALVSLIGSNITCAILKSKMVHSGGVLTQTSTIILLVIGLSRFTLKILGCLAQALKQEMLDTSLVKYVIHHKYL